ncbi:hypothetical protein ACLKA6_018327 [Drosophila palustris]
MKLLALVGLILGMLYLNLEATRNICKLHDLEYGNCSVQFKRWSYSVVENKCILIKAGGCHMTVNQFKTKKDCKKKCMHTRKKTLAKTAAEEESQESEDEEQTL